MEKYEVTTILNAAYDSDGNILRRVVKYRKLWFMVTPEQKFRQFNIVTLRAVYPTGDSGDSVAVPINYLVAMKTI